MPTYVYGYRACECIRDSLPSIETAFLEAGILQSFRGHITQGCYSTTVKDSALTHAGGGVWDFDDFTAYRDDADVLFTANGVIAFYRPPGALGKGSKPHWHAVWFGCPHLSGQASDQLTEALAGRNGLAGKGKDTGPRPSVTWQQALTHDMQELDMNSLIFMRTIDNGPGYVSGTIWLLRPGALPRRLTPTEWQLYIRLGAQRFGGNFLKAEVDIVSATLQP